MATECHEQSARHLDRIFRFSHFFRVPEPSFPALSIAIFCKVMTFPVTFLSFQELFVYLPRNVN